MKTNETNESRFYPGYFSKPRNYQKKEKKRRVFTACHPSLWNWMNNKTFSAY